MEISTPLLNRATSTPQMNPLSKFRSCITTPIGLAWAPKGRGKWSLLISIHRQMDFLGTTVCVGHAVVFRNWLVAHFRVTPRFWYVVPTKYTQIMPTLVQVLWRLMSLSTLRDYILFLRQGNFSFRHLSSPRYRSSIHYLIRPQQSKQAGLRGTLKMGLVVMSLLRFVCVDTTQISY